MNQVACRACGDNFTSTQGHVMSGAIRRALIDAGDPRAATLPLDHKICCSHFQPHEDCGAVGQGDVKLYHGHLEGIEQARRHQRPKRKREELDEDEEPPHAGIGSLARERAPIISSQASQTSGAASGLVISLNRNPRQPNKIIPKTTLPCRFPNLPLSMDILMLSKTPIPTQIAL